MKNLILILTIAIATSACSKEQWQDVIYGPPEDPRTHSGVDSEFRTYVGDFEKHLGAEVYGLPMNFVIQPTGRAGVCYIYEVRDEEFREIQIDPDGWEKLTHRQRRSLVFHELGHCVMNEAHIPDEREDGCAWSIMHPFLQADFCLEEYELDYDFNLFH